MNNTSLTNYENSLTNITPQLKINGKNEYRARPTILYEELNAVKPIDNIVNNVVYLQKNIEKGLSINTNINNLRQIWTEYRLLYNEKNSSKAIARNLEKKQVSTPESYLLTNFDEIFQELNKKVDGVGGIIDDLNNMKSKIHSSNLILGANQKSFELYMQQERAKLEKEKQEFELLKLAQSKKLEEEHRKISAHYKKIQELINKVNTQIDKLY